MNRSNTPLRPDLTRSLRNGSLAECEAPYRKWLDERGYATSTSRAYILCLTHFAKWASDSSGTPRKQRKFPTLNRVNLRWLRCGGLGTLPA